MRSLAVLGVGGGTFASPARSQFQIDPNYFKAPNVQAVREREDECQRQRRPAHQADKATMRHSQNGLLEFFQDDELNRQLYLSLALHTRLGFDS